MVVCRLQGEQSVDLVGDRPSDTGDFGVNLGERDRTGAVGLWQSLLPVYRQCAVCFTAFWQAYEQVLTNPRHRAVGKDSGKTSYVERFNNTLRQRVGRLVRRAALHNRNMQCLLCESTQKA